MAEPVWLGVLATNIAKNAGPNTPRQSLEVINCIKPLQIASMTNIRPLKIGINEHQLASTTTSVISEVVGLYDVV